MGPQSIQETETKTGWGQAKMCILGSIHLWQSSVACPGHRAWDWPGDMFEHNSAWTGAAASDGLVRTVQVWCRASSLPCPQSCHGGPCIPCGTATSSACNEQPVWELKAHCLQREIYRINIDMLHCGLQILQRLGEVVGKNNCLAFCKISFSHESEKLLLIMALLDFCHWAFKALHSRLSLAVAWMPQIVSSFTPKWQLA